MPVKRDLGETAPHRRRIGDLQFAGLASACLIAAVLATGALLAPFTQGGESSGGAPASPREQTVRLSPPAPALVDGLPQPVRARPVTLVRLQGTQASGSKPAPSLASTDDEPRKRLREATVSTDSDGDGLPDLWEIQYGLDPHNASDAGADADADGLDNLTEMRLHTAPRSSDSNGDGVLDGDEDSDRDGLRNRIETQIGTDPTRGDSNQDGQSDAQDDSDGDGAGNLAEQEAGTDPGSGEEVPEPEVADPTPVVTESDPVIIDDGSADDGAGTPPPPPPPADDDPAPPAPPPAPETPQEPTPPVPDDAVPPAVPETPQVPDEAPAPLPDVPAPAPAPELPAPAPATDLPVAAADTPAAPDRHCLSASAGLTGSSDAKADVIDLEGRMAAATHRSSPSADIA